MNSMNFFLRGRLVNMMLSNAIEVTSTTIAIIVVWVSVITFLGVAFYFQCILLQPFDIWYNFIYHIIIEYVILTEFEC